MKKQEPIKPQIIEKAILKPECTVINETNEEEHGFKKGSIKLIIEEFFGKTEDIPHEVIEPKQIEMSKEEEAYEAACIKALKGYEPPKIKDLFAP